MSAGTPAPVCFTLYVDSWYIPIKTGTDCQLLAVSKEQCASECLAGMVKLHRNRILGRLGSHKFKRPKGCQQVAKAPIGSRVKELAAKATALQKANRANDDHAIFANQLRKLSAAINAIDTAGGNDTPQLIDVVKAAYAVTIDGVALHQRLQALGYPPSTHGRREVRQIQALGNYWRICDYLAKASRSHRQLFSTLELCIVKAYPPEYWPPKSRTKHYVHAEVQLLVHHEMSPNSNRPGYIGTSKKACFLCHSLIQAHGKYRAQDSHGVVYKEWTVPDRKDYDTVLRAALARALQKMASDVKKALKQSRKATSRPAPPGQQSLFNLVLDSLRSPSVSTLRSRAGSSKASAIVSQETISASALVPGFAPATQSVQRVDSHHTKQEKKSEQAPDPEAAEGATALASEVTKYSILHGVSTQVQLSERLTLFVDLEHPDVERPYNSASCYLRSVATMDSPLSAPINIAELKGGDEVVVKGDDGRQALQFILGTGDVPACCVELEWHADDSSCSD